MKIDHRATGHVDISNKIGVWWVTQKSLVLDPIETYLVFNIMMKNINFEQIRR